MTWLAAAPFEAGFYFAAGELEGARNVTLHFEVEGEEPVVIERVEAYSAPDAMFRLFENGIVLANPSPAPVSFNLSELSPGVTYRRLAGSAHQDPSTNNEEAVAGRVTLGAKDGLFLVKRSTE
jgi:hypothetical protein